MENAAPCGRPHTIHRSSVLRKHEPQFGRGLSTRQEPLEVLVALMAGGSTIAAQVFVMEVEEPSRAFFRN